MGQITLKIDKDVEALIAQRAKAENLSPSLWLSQYIEQQVKLNQLVANQKWAAEIKALASSWFDFPNLEEIRSNSTPDSWRESF